MQLSGAQCVDDIDASFVVRKPNTIAAPESSFAEARAFDFVPRAKFLGIDPALKAAMAEAAKARMPKANNYGVPSTMPPDNPNKRVDVVSPAELQKRLEEAGNVKGVALCRCYKSSTFPYCDGAHTAHNKETGDNAGPLIIKKIDDKAVLESAASTKRDVPACACAGSCRANNYGVASNMPKVFQVRNVPSLRRQPRLP